MPEMARTALAPNMACRDAVEACPKFYVSTADHWQPAYLNHNSQRAKQMETGFDF